jgi:hypothetical protein
MNQLQAGSHDVSLQCVGDKSCLERHDGMSYVDKNDDKSSELSYGSYDS